MIKSTCTLAIVLILLAFLGCQNASSTKVLQKDTETDLNTHVIWPQSFLDANSEKAISELKKLTSSKKTFVIKYLNSNCSVCLSEIKEWETLIKNNPSILKNKTIFIVSGDSPIDIDFVFHQANSELSYMYDINFEFMDSNNISADRKLQTIVVDKNHKITFLGSPFESFDNFLKALGK